MREELLDIYDEITGTNSYDRLIPFFKQYPETLDDISLEDLLWEKLYFIKGQSVKPIKFDESFISYWEQLDKAARYIINQKKEEINLHLAVGFESIDKLDSYLSDYTSIDIMNVREETPLHIAVMLGKLDFVTKLIQKGADINFEDNECFMPLDYSWHNGIRDLKKKKGASSKQDMDKLMDDYCNARSELNDVRECNLKIMRACEIGNVDLVKKAFEMSPNKILTQYFAYPSNGKSPLHLAVENNQILIVDFLIANDFVLDKKDIYNKTPLDYAKENKSYEIENKIITAHNTRYSK